MFTINDVQALRVKTGVGMMDCKKALTEAEGDMEKAIVILREKGMATATKRADKIASQGIVTSVISNDGKVGVVLEVNCESDFVAKGDQFTSFVKSVADQIIATNPKDIESLMNENSVDDKKLTISDLLHDATARIGEKIDIRRFQRFDITNQGAALLDSYIHMGGKIGVMVEICGANANDKLMELAHDVALQIAAANPSYINKDEVPATEIEKEKEILKAQALNEDKPKPLNIIEKMIEGRIAKYFKEVCLNEQPFVKNGDQTIKDLLKDASKTCGSELTIKSFVRYEMGAGLEKKSENLANEVDAQIAAMKAKA